jgi:hypothetical protein
VTARVVAVALLLLTGCKETLVPLPLPEGSRPFVPEPVFRAWWAQMEACSGKSAPFDRVTWYVVPGEVPFRVPNHPQPVVGYWDPADNRIVVLQFLPNRRAPLIRHEALHAITKRLDHPDEYFVEKCGAVIDGPENPNPTISRTAVSRATGA